MTGSHNLYLVSVSLVLAFLTGYCTTEIAARTRISSGWMKWTWLGAGALVLGTGTWSVHFVGMLAYSLPIQLGYDVTYTIASWIVPVLTTGLALYLVQRVKLQAGFFIAGTVLMGAAFAAMHYIGMAALLMAPGIRYDAALAGISLLGSTIVSAAAIYALRKVTENAASARIVPKITAAVLFGSAIAMMHYVGIAAAEFLPGSVCLASTGGLSGAKLPVTVSAASALLIFATILIAMHEKHRIGYEHVQQTDPLTKLQNRHAFQKQLPELIEQARTNETSLHLALVDIDAFKLINDTHGHEIGDEVLVAVARRIEECLRQHDIVVRLGGDEYMIVLTGANGSVPSIMDRIISKLSLPIPAAGEAVAITVSAGLAEYAPGESIEILMSRADYARQHAKRDGRNTWRAFAPDMDTERVAAVETHKGLRRALERNEFRLYYQPKYRSGTRDIIGVEALVRWKDPARGLRMPGEFIGVAERTGLIAALGDWVLNEACRQIKCWMTQGWLVPVSINLSALQVRNIEIADKVRDALAQHEVSAGSLTLEITESVAIEDPLQAMTVFQSLRDCGVSISIDDFGTGYSSLAYLRDFPAGELKIDKAFVRDIAVNRQALELVKAIVAMGHALGMLVVAEGVEDETTTRLLEGLGCDVLQGYYFGVPMAASDLEGMLGKKTGSAEHLLEAAI